MTRHAKVSPVHLQLIDTKTRPMQCTLGNCVAIFKRHYFKVYLSKDFLKYIFLSTHPERLNEKIILTATMSFLLYEGSDEVACLANSFSTVMLDNTNIRLRLGSADLLKKAIDCFFKGTRLWKEIRNLEEEQYLLFIIICLYLNFSGLAEP